VLLVLHESCGDASLINGETSFRYSVAPPLGDSHVNPHWRCAGIGYSGPATMYEVYIYYSTASRRMLYNGILRRESSAGSVWVLKDTELTDDPPPLPPEPPAPPPPPPLFLTTKTLVNSRDDFRGSTGEHPHCTSQMLQPPCESCAWCLAQAADTEQYAILDAGYTRLLTSVATRGRLTGLYQRVTAYSLSASNFTSGPWVPLRFGGHTSFPGNKINSEALVSNEFDDPVTAQYVKLTPIACADWCSLQWAVRSLPDATRWDSSLVNPDDQHRTSTGSHAHCKSQKLQKPCSDCAWCLGAAADPSLYVALAIGAKRLVSGVITKGRLSGQYQRVTQYTVQLSNSSEGPWSVATLGNATHFYGNLYDSESPVRNEFDTPMVASHVRLTPTACAGGYCSLQWGVVTFSAVAAPRASLLMNPPDSHRQHTGLGHPDCVSQAMQEPCDSCAWCLNDFPEADKFVVMDMGDFFPVAGIVTRGRGTGAYQRVTRYNVAMGNSSSGPWFPATLGGDLSFTGNLDNSETPVRNHFDSFMIAQYVRFEPTDCDGGWCSFQWAALLAGVSEAQEYPELTSPPPPAPPSAPPPSMPPSDLYNPDDSLRSATGAHEHCTSQMLQEPCGSCAHCIAAQPSPDKYAVIDLGSTRAVFGVATRGRSTGEYQRVTAYTIEIGSSAAGPWQMATQGGNQEIAGNAAVSDELVSQSFDGPIQGQYVKFTPTACAGGYCSFQWGVYVSGAGTDGCSAIDGGDWTLVRRVQPGNMWHPAKDQLLGTEVYGTPAGERDAATFSIKFDTLPFDQFLFSTGDCSKWLIATKQAVIGSYYSNAARTILKSSTSSDPYTAAWYRRESQLEDPWISLTDHAEAIGQGNILYGENNYGSTHAAAVLPDHNGANVYVRLHTAFDGPFANQYLAGWCSPMVENSTLEAAIAAVAATAGCHGVTHQPHRAIPYTGRAGSTLYDSPSGETSWIVHGQSTSAISAASKVDSNATEARKHGTQVHSEAYKVTKDDNGMWLSKPLAGSEDQFMCFVGRPAEGNNLKKYKDKTMTECSKLCVRNDLCLSTEYFDGEGDDGDICILSDDVGEEHDDHIKLLHSPAWTTCFAPRSAVFQKYYGAQSLNVPGVGLQENGEPSVGLQANDVSSIGLQLNHEDLYAGLQSNDAGK